MRVYITRHGETCYNRKKLFQAGDEPLSDLGKEQAYKIAEKLSKCDIRFVVTSTLLRAKETGKIIAEKLGVRIKSQNFLNEILWSSDLVNKWRFSPHSLFVATLILINANIPKWYHKDGENMCDLSKRAKEAILYMENKNKDIEHTFLVVTHRGMYAMLLEHMRNNNHTPNLQKVAFDAVFNGAKNTEITVCDYDGKKWDISAFNEAIHL